MEELVIDSCVRGHHVSKGFWSSNLGEELQCERESGNPTDPYAVAVKKDAVTVIGPVPRKISAAFSLFLRNRGTILCTITPNRRFSAVRRTLLRAREKNLVDFDLAVYILSANLPNLVPRQYFVLYSIQKSS